jgi:hypothetical protein
MGNNKENTIERTTVNLEQVERHLKKDAIGKQILDLSRQLKRG